MPDESKSILKLENKGPNAHIQRVTHANNFTTTVNATNAYLWRHDQLPTTKNIAQANEAIIANLAQKVLKPNLANLSSTERAATLRNFIKDTSQRLLAGEEFSV